MVIKRTFPARPTTPDDPMQAAVDRIAVAAFDEAKESRAGMYSWYYLSLDYAKLTNGTASFLSNKKYNQWFNMRGILFCYIFVILVNMPVVIPLIYYDTFGLNNMGLCAVNPMNKLTTICALSGQ
uniref:Uncharacterized protein n=1 Tax=Romanomermis culicivorax TaxID=13658 RepID=A0A915IIU3_ROMCU